MQQQNVLGRNTFDAIEVSPKYSVYPNLPEFLNPLLKKAGLGGSPSTRYRPRFLLGDQPIITLAEKDDNDFDISMSLKAQHREHLEHQWSVLERLMSGTGTEAEADPEDSAAYAAQCEKWHQVSGFAGTVQEFANMFAKMQLFPNLYGGAQSYPVFLLRQSETADPALFRIKDPRCGNKTFLHAACATRDLQTAQFILNHGADVNATDGKGMTPLMQTFLEPFVFFRGAPGNPVMEKTSDIPAEMTIQVAQFLISQGAIMEFEYRGIPLINIIETKHFNANKPKLVDFLVRHGHPVDTFHPRYGTPLLYAAINVNVDSTRRLLRLGANPNAKLPPEVQRGLGGLETLHGPETLLEAVAQDCLDVTEDPARLEIFELLLKHGAAVTPRQGQIGWSDGSPVAHVFLLKDRVDMLRILLKYHPAMVLSTNAARLTPLHLAAWTRNLEAVQLLIDHGADVNARSMDGVTPLIAAFGYNKGMLHEDEDGDRTVEPPELVEEAVEIGHVLGAYGADITARRSWPFAAPTRIYLECGHPEDYLRGLPLTFTDDASVKNWKMWALRRK
jgi:ankyrin repeat protein